MTNYWDLPGFDGVYLEDSWVTDVTAKVGRLEIEIDLVLLETHPAFLRPEPGEAHCYRPGLILIDGVASLLWNNQTQKPAVGGDGEVDYGSIDVFEVEGHYCRLVGDFGSIEITSRQSPAVRLSRGSSGQRWI